MGFSLMDKPPKIERVRSECHPVVAARLAKAVAVVIMFSYYGLKWEIHFAIMAN